jgi:preprotein translocase subunit SecE
LKRKEIIKMKKIISFFSEVRSELEKVTWPKRNTVINYLSLVIVISAIVAIFVGSVDYGLTKGLESLVK